MRERFQCALSCSKPPFQARLNMWQKARSLSLRCCSLIREVHTHTGTHPTHNPAGPRDYRCQELLVQKRVSDPQGRKGTRCEFRHLSPLQRQLFPPNWPLDFVSSAFGKASGRPGVVPRGVKAYSAFKDGCNPAFPSTLLTATHAVQLRELAVLFSGPGARRSPATSDCIRRIQL